MMFCGSDGRIVCWYGKWLRNQEILVSVGLTTLWQANVGHDTIKYSRRCIYRASIIARLVIFIQQEISLKCDAKNSTYTYIYADISFSIIAIDLLYRKETLKFM